jgi:hypothetical protein
MFKKCCRCKETKPVENFSFRIAKKIFRSNCKLCEAEIAKDYRARNPQKIIQYRQKYKSEINPDYSRNRSPEAKRKKNIKEVDRRRANKEGFNEKRRKNRNCKEEYKYTLERRKLFKQNSLRGAYKTTTDLFYNSRPEGMTVDHIIPISSDKVSGLHVYWNLQYLPRELNSTKGKNFDGTYENESWRNLLH